MKGSSWIRKCFSLILCVFIALIIIAYCIDPFYHYRINEGSFLLTDRFVSSGLIKHYDYDAAIVGSSMTQNFNVNSFRSKLGLNPIKLTMGGMSLSETNYIMKTAEDSHKAKTYYVCCDLGLFAKPEEDDVTRYPAYLDDDNIFNDYPYLLGYDTWMRYIPIDLGINLYKHVNGDLSGKLKRKVDIDSFEEWASDFKFGRDVVLKVYKNNNGGISNVNQDNLYNRMIKRMDSLLTTLDRDRNAQYVVFFPPYSALYWVEAQNEGYFDEYMQTKKYAMQAFSERPNITVYDFQNDDLIRNLDNYKDITHYSSDINDWMVDCFASKKHIVKYDSIDASIDKLSEQIKQFRKDNIEILK